ncbi:MAG TPA: hypothetical protein VJ032_00405 [Thermoanaerobaculia bacterium]|nr:hypothetical protein [Thermoanaerobaculia bacterium]
MWILWMIAAVSLIAFYAWWSVRIGKFAPVVIASAGLVCDLTGESLFIFRPELDRAASLLTGGAANGLYTICGILLTLATPSVPLRWLAWIAWASGIVLIIVTIFNSRIGVMIATAALMASFIPFVIAMARE